MGKKLIYISILISSFFVYSCSDYYEHGFNDEFNPSLVGRFLRPSKSEFVTSYKAYQDEFSVGSMNTTWAFSNMPKWLSLSPNEGDTTTLVALSAEENQHASPRTALFYLNSTLQGWEYSRSMSISQGGATPYISLSTSDLSFGGGISSKEIKVSANCNWYTNNTNNWITTKCDIEQGILTVTVSPNNTGTFRSGKFSVEYNKKSYTINVYQATAGIKSSATTLKYENIASSYAIQIDAEADWSTVTTNNWINVTPSKGTHGVSDITIEVAPNAGISSRAGYVTFYIGDKAKLQIEIVQRGLYIEADKELHFSTDTQSKILSIQSNTDWQVLRSPNWVSLSTKQGRGNGEITVTALENPNSTIREGEIILGQIGLDLNYAVYVTQGAKTLAMTKSQINFSDKGGIDSLRIISNASWTTKLSDSWFTATPHNGVGNASIHVSATENCSAIERIGTIEYQYADNAKHINIHQLAKYLTVDNKSFDFESTGGSHIVEIATNTRWSAELEHEVDWLKLSSSTGDGNTQLIITAEDNPSVNLRSTAVIIKSEYSQDYRILVSQKPRTLSVNCQKLLFFSKGGASGTINVNTDGQFEITTEEGWLTVNKGGNKSFVIHAAANNSDDFRFGKITISLTDLVDCSLSLEIPVMQAGKGASFIVGGFTDDSNWDMTNTDSLKLSVTGYKSDASWDNESTGKLVLKVTGYTTEHDWNKNDYFNGRATIVTYGKDHNWNSSDNSGNITGGGYSDDSDYNFGNNSGNLNGSDYDKDNDWNDRENSGDMSGNGYSDDINFDNNNNNGKIGVSDYEEDKNWNE